MQAVTIGEVEDVEFSVPDQPEGVAPSGTRAPVFVPWPEAVANSQLTAFVRYCELETHTRFSDQAAFHRFSVEEFQTFWRLFLQWSDILREGAVEPVCTAAACEHASFFPNLRLNYAQNLLRADIFDDASPAITACHSSGERERLSRGELRDRVARLAAAYRDLGIRPGDRIVAVAHNNAGVIVAALAAAAAGATVSTAAPDMGVPSILSRFRQLDPVLLLADTQVPAGGAPLPLAERVAEVAHALPSLRTVILLDGGPLPPGLPVPSQRLEDLIARTPAWDWAAWPRLGFNHPLFILFSSGTTGQPKCIVHGAGGTLLEHLKEHRLHGDLRPTDTLFFHTSAAWMMWNWQLSALACGAGIVVYDGPVTGPDTLWRTVANEAVTAFGTSPPYLQLCQDSGYEPARAHDLSALRAVMSTGSILYDRQYDWIREHVGPLPLQSISGGTDIVGCFVLGNPNLPVYRGESQCRSLGLDVQAERCAGSVTAARIGELVCRNPFPSRPLSFHGDAGGERFHRAYFSQNPGVWTHGDLIEFTEEGTARLHGRSDGVLNVNGFRIGPAEIYRILQGIPEIREALAVEQQASGAISQTRLVLLVVMNEPGALDQALCSRIRRMLAHDGSSAHVPAVIAEVRELPVTHSGKRSERAACDALNDRLAGNTEALKNPECLEDIRRQGGLADAASAAVPVADDGSVEDMLRVVWEALLGVSPVKAEDDFFDLGGTSLLAVRLFQEIRDRLGLELPPSVLYQAPTLGTLAGFLAAGADVPFSPLVLLRSGSGRPLFFVHGLRGDILEFRPLIAHLQGGRPVYGIQARGLDRREQPHERVEDMAAYYVEHLRRLQPAGPYALLGYSFGGLVAYEMARLLHEAGEEVEIVGLLDTYVHENCLPPLERLWFHLTRPLRRARRKARIALRLDPPEVLPSTATSLPLLQEQGRLSWKAFSTYRPGPFAGRTVFFRAARRWPWHCEPLTVWRRAASSGLTVTEVPCTHFEMMREPKAAVLAEILARHQRP